MKWSRRFREKRQRTDGPRWFVDGFAATLCVMALATFVLGGYAYFKRPPVVLRDFDARVVDKSLTLSETWLGTRPVMHLLVETSEGRRFRVSVTADFYEQAEVGMWLSRRWGELELSREKPPPAPPGGEGTRFEAR